MTNIVLDLEWNYPEGRIAKVNGLSGEIIQIGAAKIDDEANVLDSFSVTVKPTYYTKLRKEVAELTLITEEELSRGVVFPEALSAFKKWCGSDFLFITWSPSDLPVLKSNIEVFGLDSGWLPKTYDAQLMFDDLEMQEDRDWPLNYALYHFNEKPDGAHNALADVISTCLVLKHLGLKEALTDEYFRYDDLQDDEE